MNNTQKLQLGFIKLAMGIPHNVAADLKAKGVYDVATEAKPLRGLDRGASKATGWVSKHLGKLGPKGKLLAGFGTGAGLMGLGGFAGNRMGYGSGQNDGAMAAMHAFENNNKGFGGFLNHLMASVGAKSTPSMFGLDR